MHLDLGAERRVVIRGIGASDVGRNLSVPASELMRQASLAAIADAGLGAGDIDGVASIDDPATIAATLGLSPRWQHFGGGPGGLLAPVVAGVEAVATRRARHVLVSRTVQMLDGTISRAGATSASTPEWAPPLIAMHAYSAAHWVAMHCRRHMHVYGTTREQLGWLAVSSRAHAGRNPLAVYRTPLTLDEYLNGRPISDPLCLYDCDVPVDGSMAFIISRLGEDDAPHPSVRFEAIGTDSSGGDWDSRPDYPNMAATDAARDMWNRTDLRPLDVDVAQLYDGFTYLALAWLEALGFCEPGAAGPFVEGGQRIGLEGELPLNTYGGQLSAGRLHGYWVLHEAVLQLRGLANERQVADARVAVVSAGGGPIAACAALSRA